MNYFNRAELPSFTLKTIQFLTPAGIKEIPSEKMLEEAMSRRPLDLDYALDVLLHNRLELSLNLEETISRNSPGIWSEITEELATDIRGNSNHNGKYNPKLYAFFSLQKHRINIQTQDSISSASFIGWSNWVVEQMVNIPENLILKEFCSKKNAMAGIGCSYDRHRYHESVWSYCSGVLPRPLQSFRSPTLELN